MDKKLMPYLWPKVGVIMDDLLKGYVEGIKTPWESQIEQIVKDIRDRKDNAMAMEFTKVIGEMLKSNGVTPKITEVRTGGTFDKDKNVIKETYGVSIDSLDFTEHDKVFEDKIAELKEKNKNLVNMLNKIQLEKAHIVCDLYDAEQRIAELKSKQTETCKKEPISDDSEPSTEWYDNRHQSDCIEINRLNTTIDVLIHKIEYLRQFAGL